MSKTRNCVSKTRNCVSKTRDFAGIEWPRPDFPVMFMRSESEEASDGSSKYVSDAVCFVCIHAGD